MVSRREAALASVVRSLVAATKRWEKASEISFSELGDIQNDAEWAISLPSKAPRKRAVLRLSQGALSLSWADRGVKITLHDEDKAQTRHWSGSLKPGKGDRVEPWEGR